MTCQTAGFHGFHQIHGRIKTRSGHFQSRTAADTGYMIVAGAPVRHDEAVEAPAATECVLQQIGVFVGISAVYPVVGGHDGLGCAFRYRDFKIGQVNFP